jgi:hypothetical protein
MEPNASPASAAPPSEAPRPRRRRPPSALPRRKPSLGEIAAVAFAIFVVVPALFSAIGLVAYAAQGVTEVWQINLILTATCGLFIFSLLKGIRLASNLIDAIDRKRARR